VWDDFVKLIKDGSLMTNVWYTFRRIMIASTLSGIVALLLGLIIHNVPVAKASIGVLIDLLRYVPVTAFYPLLIMWAGIGEEMKIAFLFIASFVYMMPSVVLALEETPEEVIDTGKTMGMNPIQIIIMIQLPSTLPSILNSFVMMIGIGWTYCAVVETINAKYGIGYVIQQASSRGKTDLVFMAIIVIMICSFVIDNVLKWIIRKIFRWRYIEE
jgi:NitT/TauT family transport system permease protein